MQFGAEVVRVAGLEEGHAFAPWEGTYVRVEGSECGQKPVYCQSKEPDDNPPGWLWWFKDKWRIAQGEEEVGTGNCIMHSASVAKVPEETEAGNWQVKSCTFRVLTRHMVPVCCCNFVHFQVFVNDEWVPTPALAIDAVNP